MSDLTDLGNRIARAMQHMDAWDTPGDLIADLADEGLALVPAADVYELQAAQEQLTECVRALELEKSANANLQKVIDALSAAQTADVPTPEERAIQRARRAAKTELPHGIPEGENDKGWPEGTPDSVTKGERNV